MLRKLAAVAFCISSIVSASDHTTIAFEHLMASSQRQGHEVTFGKKGFLLNGAELQPYEVDPSLRGITTKKQLTDLFKSNRTKLLVNGARYRLERQDQLKGGGLFGTTLGANIGYWGVHGITQAIVGIVVQPAYWILGPGGAGVHYAVSGAVHGLVQPLAITAGVAGGIAGGVATGPV